VDIGVSIGRLHLVRDFQEGPKRSMDCESR
jgi:hypothetical protein